MAEPWKNTTDIWINLLKNIRYNGWTAEARRGKVRQLGAVSFWVPAHDTISFRKFSTELAEKELILFLAGATSKSDYEKQGIKWWSREKAGNVPYAFLSKYKAAAQFAYQNSKNAILIYKWNPDDCMTPCIFSVQFIRDKDYLELIVYQRSLDVMVGMPYDVYQMQMLLKLAAEHVKLIPWKVTFFVGNAHYYNVHEPYVTQAINGEYIEDKILGEVRK